MGNISGALAAKKMQDFKQIMGKKMPILQRDKNNFITRGHERKKNTIAEMDININDVSSERLMKMGKINLKNPRTHSNAFRYFNAAAERKHVPAYGWMAHCFHAGKGTPRNLDAAVRWYQAAANEKNGNGNTRYMV